MKDLRILALLRSFLAFIIQQENFEGMCYSISEMKNQGIITPEDWWTLHHMINDHSSLSYLFSTSAFYWEVGWKYPRIRWIKRRIRRIKFKNLFKS